MRCTHKIEDMAGERRDFSLFVDNEDVDDYRWVENPCEGLRTFGSRENGMDRVGCSGERLYLYEDGLERPATADHHVLRVCEDSDGERSEGRHGRRRRRRRRAVSHVSELGAVSIYTPGQNGPLRLLQSFALLAPPPRPHRRPRRPRAPRPHQLFVLTAPLDVCAPTIFLVCRDIASHHRSRISGLSIPHKPRLSRISASFSSSCRLSTFLPPHPLRRRLLHDEPNTVKSLTTPTVCAQHQPRYSQRSVNLGRHTSTVTTSNSFIRCNTAVYANIW